MDVLEFEETEIKETTPKRSNSSLRFHTPAAPASVRSNSVLKAVIKVYCTTTRPNFSSPWQMERQIASTSSAFIISGRRILCNAHGVAFHSTVRVRKHGDSTKYIARVVHAGHECDLAMLSVDSEEFWSGLEPLSFGPVPQLQDAVICVGYPTGGDAISVTQGIVSRLAVAKYSHGDENLLIIQIDAAINAGNSGGPALDSRQRVIGVAFETLEGAENIGYIIPIPVVEHFLHDIETTGKYQGFCSPAFNWQVCENPGMRDSLKIPHSEGGVLISQVHPLADCARVIQANDVLLAFDGVPIGQDGTIGYRGGERVSFMHLFTSKFVGDSACVSLLREGKCIELKFTLSPRIELCPVHMYDKLPPYFIFAGLCFTVLSCPFLEAEYGEKWDKKAPINLCERVFYGYPQQEGQQVVIMNQVLTAPVNIGYEEFSNLQVVKVNGVDIINLKQMMWLVKTAKTEYIRFDMFRHSAIIVSRLEAEKCHKQNLKDNNVPQDMDDGLAAYYTEMVSGEGGQTEEAKPEAKPEPKPKRGRKRA